MKTYDTGNVRNVVLLGGPKAGKTLFAESMMFEGKVIERRGTIEGKNTMSDNTEIEQENQRSIYSTLLYTEFLDTKFNIIDTPGSDDFVGGVYSAFSVCESGIMLVNSTQGVEVGTEIFTRQALKHNKPLTFAISQLDHEKADWHMTLESLKNVYGGKILLVQYPVNPGPSFDSFIDVLKIYLAKQFHEKLTQGVANKIRKIVGIILMIFSVLIFMQSFKKFNQLDKNLEKNGIDKEKVIEERHNK